MNPAYEKKRKTYRPAYLQLVIPCHTVYLDNFIIIIIVKKVMI